MSNADPGSPTGLPVLQHLCGTGVRSSLIGTRLDPGAPRPSVLLIGPYDPHCGEYTFLAPPLGVWRLQGVLEEAGCDATVFDPNIVDGSVDEALAEVLDQRPWDVIGSSTTGMTLRFDLALAHQARRARPSAVLVAGGMEATFKPELMFEIGPFDLVVLGEGEKPLIDLARRVAMREPWTGIPGTAHLDDDGAVARHHQDVLDPDELREAIRLTPYEHMPYEAYWERLEAAYQVGRLPYKAMREARLAEIRSVRLITLNYCPMGCSFCSSTNFLHAAKGGRARIRRLDADEILSMVERIVAAQPDVRTVIFQDDIFVFTSDDRILPLCESIVEAKASGRIPADLQFISTNRIDAMTPERLLAMRVAGFRVLGFGIENFSLGVLEEFNKARIAPHIEPNLQTALDVGITPFLDLILTSPRSSLEDLATTISQAFRWLRAGCEMGMYPYVIPFSGAAMAEDPTLVPHTVYSLRGVRGTSVRWRQPTKILPIDPELRLAIERIEEAFERRLAELGTRVAHLPSRIRSLVWILSAVPVLRDHGFDTPDPDVVEHELQARLPGSTPEPAPVAEALSA